MSRSALPRRSAASSIPIRRNIVGARVLAVADDAGVQRPDRLAAEEPLEIRVGGPGSEPGPVAVTMRTPGADFDLAVGFLFTEGLIGSREEVSRVAYCALPEDEQHYNVVTITLGRRFDPGSVRRNFLTTSACGVCGKASLEDVEVRSVPIAQGPVVARAVIHSLPGALREAQRVFELTGGLHAAGLFAPDGELLAHREDVGRHNAVDKLIGGELLGGRVPLSDRILLVSGRASFEIVQKAAVAGIPIIAAVSAPSSLAVEAADRLGMTIAGFVRDGRFNVYTRTDRVDLGNGRRL